MRNWRRRPRRPPSAGGGLRRRRAMATWSRCELEPMGCAPGRWLHRPPPPWQEHEAIGFDALGRVVCVRQYDATGEVWLERFASWGRDEVEVVCFRAPLEYAGHELPAELQSVLRMRLAGGKPVESERYMPPTGSCSRERYRHEGGRLARVEEDSCDEGGGLATVIKEVVYGEDGRVTGVDALGPRAARPSGGTAGSRIRRGGRLGLPRRPGCAVRSACSRPRVPTGPAARPSCGWPRRSSRRRTSRSRGPPRWRCGRRRAAPRRAPTPRAWA